MNNDKSPATDMVNMYGAVTIYQEYGGFISFNEYNKIILLQLNNFK